MSEEPKSTGRLDHLTDEEKEDLISSTRSLHTTLSTLSDEEIEDILSNTRVIHTDRDMPEDTQMLHVIQLEQISKERHKKVRNILVFVVLLGILASGIGLWLNHRPAGPAPEPAQDDPAISYLVPETEDPIIVDDTTFPSAAFREWIYHEFDSDHDWHLSPSERNSIIFLNFNEDDRIENLQGIEYFNVLQGLSVNGTSVSEVDVSRNRMLQYINISNTAITQLNLSKNSEVSEIILNGSAIQEIIFPNNSKVTKIETDNTSITCTKDDDGYYRSCLVTAE
jgi:hypothetical protein